jgi:RNA polymerase sigma-54 factor
MKQSIQLRLGQNLTMTPQLQQAIKLLQLSTLDLQMEIQNILDSNLMLEKVDEDNEPEPTTENEARVEEKDNQETAVSEDNEVSEYTSEASQDNIPDDLPVDSAWEDVYDGSTSYSQPSDSDQIDNFEINRGTGETLQEHLLWQMQLSHLSETDQAIAMAIIDSIDEDGYLQANLEDIRQNLQKDLEDEIYLDEVEAVLHMVQHYDPVGSGSRSLGECLMVQLQQFSPDTPWLNEAKDLVENSLELLGNHDLPQLKRSMKLSDEDLQQVISLIQSLNPRPGAELAGTAPEYIVPDVLVRKYKGNWRVELNPDTVPRLRVNNLYANLIKRSDNSDDNNTLKNHLQEARWFLKSLQSRNETLLKVATCIVERQRGFLDYGDEAMKPLVLREVAEAVEMHESTISRVTTQKYMHTPRGIYEFKYFFSSHVSTADGGECSATAIRAIIKKLIASEDPAKPLSDSKIAEMLLKQGIKVARRTVAKYREAMNLSPSNERKRLA